MSRLTFPPSYRLTRRPQFCSCYDRGRRFFSKSFILFVNERPDEGTWRLGLAVSRKIGPAVRRNRIKRLVREFFRLHQQKVTRPVDIVVVPKRGVNINALKYAHVAVELEMLLARITSRGAGV